VVLIPKKSIPYDISKFKPVRRCNIVYEIVSM